MANPRKPKPVHKVVIRKLNDYISVSCSTRKIAKELSKYIEGVGRGVVWGRNKLDVIFRVREVYDFDEVFEYINETWGEKKAVLGPCPHCGNDDLFYIYRCNTQYYEIDATGKLQSSWSREDDNERYLLFCSACGKAINYVTQDKDLVGEYAFLKTIYLDLDKIFEEGE